MLEVLVLDSVRYLPERVLFGDQRLIFLQGVFVSPLSILRGHLTFLSLHPLVCQIEEVQGWQLGAVKVVQALLKTQFSDELRLALKRGRYQGLEALEGT
jgi:hypothetical protein